MKWLLMLFSLYILVLSGIPCDCREDSFSDGIAAISTHDHDTDHQKTDCPCSPFFACSTCHGVILPDDAFRILKPVYADKQVFFAYAEHTIHQSPPAIFQPPRLA